MMHFTTESFWNAYQKLPLAIQQAADKNFELLKSNPGHPSLQLKKIGQYYSARVTIKYRALGLIAEDTIIWFWIGSHAQYDELIKTK